MLIKLILLMGVLIGLSLLPSCQPKIIYKTETIIKDSIVEKIVRRDTTILTPVDSAKIKSEVICTDSGAYMPETIATSGRSKVSVKINKGKIEANCLCDSAAIKIEVYDKLVKQYKSEMIKESKQELPKANPIKKETTFGIFIKDFLNMFLWFIAAFVGGIIGYYIRYLKDKFNVHS